MRWFRRRPKNDFRPTRPRTRLLIALLAVATAGMVMWAVMDPLARLDRMNRPPADRPACAPGQLDDCAGGKVTVIVVPATPPGPASGAGRP